MKSAAAAGLRRRTIGELIIAHRKGWEQLSNLVFALYAGAWTCLTLVDFLTRHRVSSALLIVYDAMICWFVATRPPPRETNVSPRDWIVGFLSFLPLLLYPASEVHDRLLLLAVQVSGQAVAVAGTFSLNTSFGLVAANRGVKTGGMFRLVRHPIVLGMFASVGAYVLQNLTVRNAVVFLAYVVVQVTRMELEEQLMSKDPEYVSYARRTRWRVLPYVY
jgi:protein-S-isoprenylcysteine O-methyltransferase Ste14